MSTREQSAETEKFEEKKIIKSVEDIAVKTQFVFKRTQYAFHKLI